MKTETRHPQASLEEQQADLVTGGVRSRGVATQTLHPGHLATSVVPRKEKRENQRQCALLTRGERDEQQHPTAPFWVLHPHPRGVGEAILALLNVEEGHHQERGGGRPQEREKGERAVLGLHPRGTEVAEAPLLLLGSEDEALMCDENRKVLSTSERMIPLLLLLPQSNSVILRNRQSWLR